MAHVEREVGKGGRLGGDGAARAARPFSRVELEPDVHRLSLGELMKEASTEVSRLMRGELEVAKAELKAEAKDAAKASGAIAAGGVLAHTGYLAVVAGVVFLLALAIPLWASALIVGAVLIAAGAFIAKSGADKLKTAVHPPKRTIQTFEEDRRWASATLQNAKSNMRENA